MFCPNCGTQNESETTLCKNCGFKLSKVSAPKFKGTMMLNSDQSVQDLIEEHRKKLQEGAAGAKRASEPPRAPGTLSPPRPTGTVAGMPAPPRGVEAPRAASRRRMDGTMLGVAPQMGGISPPAPAPAAPSAPAAAAVAPEVPAPAAMSDSSGSGAPERSAGLASTMALPSPGSLVSAAREVVAAQISAGGTRPIPMQPEDSPLAGRTTAPLPLQDNTESHAGDAPAFPESVAFPESRELAGKPPPSARGPVKPWQIALIVLTCGIYGIVLLIQRRRSAGS